MMKFGELRVKFSSERGLSGIFNEVIQDNPQIMHLPIPVLNPMNLIHRRIAWLSRDTVFCRNRSYKRAQAGSKHYADHRL
jgi:hypothetical protein